MSTDILRVSSRSASNGMNPVVDFGDTRSVDEKSIAKIHNRVNPVRSRTCIRDISYWLQSESLQPEI